MAGNSVKIGSQISEDERDAEIQKHLMEKKKGRSSKKRMKKRVASMFAGQDIYLAMVKKTQNSIKELTMTKGEKDASIDRKGSGLIKKKGQMHQSKQ